MDRTGTGSRQRTPSISQRLRSAEQNAAVFDSISNASFMEVKRKFHFYLFFCVARQNFVPLGSYFSFLFTFSSYTAFCYYYVAKFQTILYQLLEMTSENSFEDIVKVYINTIRRLRLDQGLRLQVDQLVAVGTV